MNQKLHYEAPLVELIEVRMESGLLQGSANAESIQHVYSGSWDAED